MRGNNRNTKCIKLGTLALAAILSGSLALPVFAEGSYANAAEVAADPAAGYGFHDTAEGIVYTKADGTLAVHTFVDNGGKIFYVGDEGYVLYGFQTIDGKLYYLPTDGLWTQGWYDIDGGIYYVQTDGSLAQNTTVLGAVIGEDGRALSAATETEPAVSVPESTVKDPAFYNQVMSVVNACTNDSMSDLQKLRACYNWVINNVSYKRTYDTPSGDWTASYAKQVLDSGVGNCYRYAATFAYLAKALGFDAKVRTGQIQAARGGTTPHAWDIITIDGTEYIFDTEMADAKKSPDAYWMKTFAAYPVKPLIGENDWSVAF